jgi:TonB-dependent receptor
LHAGDIEGRVRDDSSGGYMPGVEIRIEGQDKKAVTDAEGRYRITNLPAGKYTVRAHSLAYNIGIQSVSVPATGDVSAAFMLKSSVYELESFKVEGYREGRQLALQQKRAANNIRDIISADSVGSLPDRNVAEALARVPGVNIDVDAGEGRFVSIRGIEPSYNNVTLDGSTLAAPSVGGRSGRSMPLDVVGSGQISQIEVIKSVTPDMDGNALGGTINIKSASAFNRPESFTMGKFELGENSVAKSTIVDTDITWGDTFNDGTVGIALSANYSNRPFVSHEVQGSWNDADDGTLFLEDYEIQPAEGERTRMGVNYNIEFRPDDDTEMYIRGIYNKFEEEERQQEFIIAGREDPIFVSDELIEVTRMRFEQRDFQREIKQTLLNVTAGMKKRTDNLTVSGDITYSFSEENVPVIKSAQFRTGNEKDPFDKGLPFQFSTANFYPQYNDQGFSTNQLDQFELRRFREGDSLVQENTWSPRLDFEWDLDSVFGGHPGTFKTGIKLTSRDRFVDDNSLRTVGGDDDFTILDIAPPGAGFSIFDGRYMYPSSLNADTGINYLNSHRGDFEVDAEASADNSREDDYDVQEGILAVYAMGTVQWNEQLSMTYGLRYEQTDADLRAFEYQRFREDDTFNIIENSSSFDYDNILPNLQFRYDIDENSLIRAAFTGTVGRPKYEDASPIAKLDLNDDWDPTSDPIDPAFPNIGELEIGNPELTPFEALNFDLSYEYYLQSGGVLTVGVFQKEIDNPIYTFSSEEDDVIYNDIAFEFLSREKTLNADSASISGIEFNLQLPFTTFFTSSNFLDGFGIDANATFISSDVTVFDRENEDLPFFKQPAEIINLAFYYQKYNFSARVAYNWQAESLDELDGNSDEDRWDEDRKYVDIQASYRLNDTFTVYANFQNVFEDNKERTYGRKSGRIRRAEFYGSNLRVGTRFNF